MNHYLPLDYSQCELVVVADVVLGVVAGVVHSIVLVGRLQFELNSRIKN